MTLFVAVARANDMTNSTLAMLARVAFICFGMGFCLQNQTEHLLKGIYFHLHWGFL
jgi:hypothetical protein